MAFIRKKQNRSGRTTYQLVRSVRQGGKVRQVMLAGLMYDSTIAGAIATLRKRIEFERGSLAHDARQRVEAMAQSYPDVKWDDWYIDIMTAKLVDPKRRTGSAATVRQAGFEGLTALIREAASRLSSAWNAQSGSSGSPSPWCCLPTSTDRNARAEYRVHFRAGAGPTAIRHPRVARCRTGTRGRRRETPDVRRRAHSPHAAGRANAIVRDIRR